MKRDNQVIAEYDEEYKAPEESFCWDLSQILVPDLLPEDSLCLCESCKEIPDKNKETCWNELLSSYSLDDLMINMTRDPIQSVVELNIFDTQRDYLENITNQDFSQYFKIVLQTSLQMYPDEI